MRLLFVVLGGLIMSPHPADAQDSVNEPLRAELLEMGRRDQEIRDKLVPLLSTQSSGRPSEEFMALVTQQRAVDKTNISRLGEIVEAHGWPGKTLVGEEASNVARMLVQHADSEHQKRYLPILKAAASAGEASAWGVAMLEDRIRINSGEKQLYGSQFERGPDGQCRITPMDDPSRVDERRQAVGLPPMREYLRELGEQLGQPCLVDTGTK